MLQLAGRIADIVGVNPNLRAGEITADEALASSVVLAGTVDAFDAFAPVVARLAGT